MRGSKIELVLEQDMAEEHEKGHRERLRQRFLSTGTKGFLDYELLELLLTYTVIRKNCRGIAKSLLKKYGDLYTILKQPEEELRKNKYMTERTVVFLKLLSENKENAMTGDDFENNKVVFISDESHHVNTFTKNRTKEEKEIQNNWETSIMNAFYSNKNSILLEFTATADLKDKNVEEKYRDKIIYNYPLKNFRESGYTKDFVNFSINTDTWKRTLIALILSEYRRFLFSDCGQNIKPVIMLKSKVIKESRSFYDEFFEKINKLDNSDFENLPKEDKYLKKALDYFRDKDKNKTFEFLKESIRDSFIEEKAIIINGNEDNNVEKQLLLNSLEDKKNNKRIIFAVDMLNEGWDVLNLFDIVRLYDTRSSASYTIKEAQLIGRGARYCPFLVNEEQEKFKRKYDSDLDNKYRILETMFFHSIDDSKYISELKKALIEIGLQEKDMIERKYILKDEFKNTDFYNHGYVFSNSRIEKTRENIYEIEEDLKYKIFYPKIKNKNAKIENHQFSYAGQQSTHNSKAGTVLLGKGNTALGEKLTLAFEPKQLVISKKGRKLANIQYQHINQAALKNKAALSAAIS
uniref:DEAD/DEAH box helicase family protein n=1 Tax=uncultured Leptotrichia sp. TaxID=159271 RepID=UPI002610DDE4